MYIGLRVKYPLFLSDFNWTWIFWTDYPRILNYKISCGSHGCSMRTDGHDEANSSFSQIRDRA